MDYSVSDVMEFVEDNDVKFVKLAFTDIYGEQKNISIASHELRKAFEQGIRFNATNIHGFGENIHTDLLLKPIPHTMNILPWRPSQGQVLRLYCDILKEDGNPYEMDCRNIFRSFLDRCAVNGITFKTALRSEFYLFRLDEFGEPTDRTIDQATYLDVSPMDRGENVRREIVLTLEEMGIETEKSYHEKGPGQNQVDFKEADALSTADNYTTFKNVVRSIAARNGMAASFLPKPIPDRSGNGLQIVFSVYQDDRNLFDSGKEKMDSFVAGMLNRMDGLTAILNSHRTSYDRFGKHEAPQYITWSDQNHGQLLKVPMEHEKKHRCILRSPDAYTNPYLAMAAVFGAGLSGMEKRETLMDPIDADHLAPEELAARYIRLPNSLDEAIEAARRCEVLKEIFGTVFMERFLAALADR